MGSTRHTQVASSTPFDNDSNGYDADNVQDAIEEGVQNALDTPIYTIVLQHNGTVSNGTWFGYDSLIPGDDTPIVVPRDSSLTGFTFSNSKSSADYTLDFRKNSTGASIFYTVSKTNTQTFNQLLPTPQDFDAGDTVFIQYGDDGSNAGDVVIMLTFKSDPI